MDAGRFGKIINAEPDMYNLVSNNDFLKAYTDSDIDYIDGSMSIYKDYEYSLKLFYKGVKRYAESYGIKPEKLFNDVVTRYRIEYNDLIIAIGVETKKDGENERSEYHIATLPDHDYASCINFNNIMEYYGGENRQHGKSR